MSVDDIILVYIGKSTYLNYHFRDKTDIFGLCLCEYLFIIMDLLNVDVDTHIEIPCTKIGATR